MFDSSSAPCDVTSHSSEEEHTPLTEGGFLGRPRFALAVAVLGASLTALPAAIRSGSPAMLSVWLTLAAASAALLGPLLAGIACAKPVNGALFSALTGLGLSALPLAVLAAKLKEATHHRPLGAVTFACIALLLVLLATGFSVRVVSWAHTRARGLTSGLALLALVGPALLIGALFSAKDARASTLDVGLTLVTAFLLGRAPWPHTLLRWGAQLALPIWLALVSAGFLLGLSDVGEAARRASPALFAPFSWLARTPR